MLIKGLRLIGIEVAVKGNLFIEDLMQGVPEHVKAGRGDVSLVGSYCPVLSPKIAASLLKPI